MSMTVVYGRCLSSHTRGDAPRSLRDRLTLIAWLIFALALSLSLGCQSSGIERICEPVTQTGCSLDQHCSVDRSGSPICIDFPSDPLKVNAPCDTSEKCPVGTGCVSLYGHARCATFCDVNDGQEGDLLCSASLGMGSECIYSLSQRDEIGVCITPCNPQADQQSEICFAGQSCQLILGDSYTTCGSLGSLERGMSCDISEACGPHLSCVFDRYTSRCEELFIGVQTCSIGEVNRVIRWARDPLSGSAYTTCQNRIDLVTRHLNGIFYQLDLTLNTGVQLRDRCLVNGPRGSSVYDNKALMEDERLRRDLVLEISALLTESSHNVPGVWLLSNTQGESSSESCQRIDLTSGALEPTPCDLNLPSLCSYPPPAL